MTDDQDGVDALEVPHYGSCPACGYVLDDTLDDARVSVPDEEDVLHVARFGCPDCGRPLRLVVESSAPDAFGVDMTLEVDRDRLEDLGGG